MAYPVEDGVSESELTAFENKYKVYLPKDLREYFTHVNGFNAGHMDDAMIRFCTLNELEPVSRSGFGATGPDYVEAADFVFLFADYLISSQAFGIRLSPEKDNQPNTVYLIGVRPVRPVARSFSDFVDIYLTDKERLLDGV